MGRCVVLSVMNKTNPCLYELLSIEFVQSYVLSYLHTFEIQLVLNEQAYFNISFLSYRSTYLHEHALRSTEVGICLPSTEDIRENMGIEHCTFLGIHEISGGISK